MEKKHTEKKASETWLKDFFKETKKTENFYAMRPSW